MVVPPPRSQEADSGGLGLLLLSICAEPSRAIIPTVKHPKARNATVLLMVFPPRKLAATIEANLLLKRNCDCRRSLKTQAREFCFDPSASWEKTRKSLNLRSVYGRRMARRQFLVWKTACACRFPHQLARSFARVSLAKKAGADRKKPGPSRARIWPQADRASPLFSW